MNNNICIIINCYKNYNVINNIHSFMSCITKSFDLFVVNNNIIDISKNFENINNIHVINGDNYCFEFSGIQKCLDNIDKNNYSMFILGTDALFNYPITFLDFINIDVINYVIDNECFVGNIDSFMKDYKFNDFFVNYWIRTSFVLINSNLFKKINYKFITYKFDDIFDDNNIKINIDNSLINFINSWLGQNRYSYINNINIKKLCIFNEWKLTNKLLQFGKIHDIITIYLLKYNDEIMTKNNKHVLLNIEKYVEFTTLKNLNLLNHTEQIHFKHKLFS